MEGIQSASWFRLECLLIIEDYFFQVGRGWGQGQEDHKAKTSNMWSGERRASRQIIFPYTAAQHAELNEPIPRLFQAWRDFTKA
jgi:hypothetical protein